MSNRQVDVIIQRKNESAAKVEAYKDAIKDHEKFQNYCKEAMDNKVDPKVIRKINYNAVIAKNAYENSDVAGPNDRSDAIKNIDDCIVNLKESSNNLDIIKKEVNKLTCADLEESKNELQVFIKNNIDSCNTAIEYSQSVKNGEFDKDLENKFNETIANQDKAFEETEGYDFGDKVVSEEPYENVEENDMFKDLDKALDEAIAPVESDINDLNVNLDNIENDIEIDDITPVETDVVTNLEENVEPSGLFEEAAPLEETEDQPLTIDNTDEIVSATSVDEGPVKVVEMLEVGAPEEEVEEEKSKSRRLAA